MPSFIIPAHNEARLPGRTLAALREAAAGVDVPAELIVVDDASTDATARFAAEHGARVISVAFRQIARVRKNRGWWVVGAGRSRSNGGRASSSGTGRGVRIRVRMGDHLDGLPNRSSVEHNRPADRVSSRGAGSTHQEATCPHRS